CHWRACERRPIEQAPKRPPAAIPADLELESATGTTARRRGRSRGNRAGAWGLFGRPRVQLLRRDMRLYAPANGRLSTFRRTSFTPNPNPPRPAREADRNQLDGRATYEPLTIVVSRRAAVKLIGKKH